MWYCHCIVNVLLDGYWGSRTRPMQDDFAGWRLAYGQMVACFSQGAAGVPQCLPSIFLGWDRRLETCLRANGRLFFPRCRSATMFTIYFFWVRSPSYLTLACKHLLAMLGLVRAKANKMTHCLHFDDCWIGGMTLSILSHQVGLEQTHLTI